MTEVVDHRRTSKRWFLEPICFLFQQQNGKARYSREMCKESFFSTQMLVVGDVSLERISRGFPWFNRICSSTYGGIIDSSDSPGKLINGECH